MFRHCVMFRFNSNVDPATVTAIESQLAELARLPMVRGYQYGPDAQLAEGNFDYVLVADFDDVAGYQAYAVDAQHQRVLKDYLRPNIADRAAVQYALD